MANTLEERVRSTYGVEGDGFFQPDAIVDNINDAYQKTVSILAKIEKEGNESLRSLDELRRKTNILLDQAIEQENGYTKTSVEKPSDVHDFLYMSFVDDSLSKTVPIDELSTGQLINLEVGNAIPSQAEMYYHRVGDSDVATPTPLIEVFGYEIVQSTDKIRLYYIKQPSIITETDTELPDLPRYLQKAVIMDTCSSLAIKDPDEKRSPEGFDKKYQSIIANNAI